MLARKRLACGWALRRARRRRLQSRGAHRHAGAASGPQSAREVTELLRRRAMGSHCRRSRSSHLASRQPRWALALLGARISLQLDMADRALARSFPGWPVWGSSGTRWGRRDRRRFSAMPIRPRARSAASRSSRPPSPSRSRFAPIPHGAVCSDSASRCSCSPWRARCCLRPRSGGPHLGIPMGATMRLLVVPLVALWGLVALRLRRTCA